VKKYYFAYGSNLDQNRLEARVGKVVNLGVHTLYGYRLSFNAGFEMSQHAFANLIPTGSMKDSVEGVVYQMSMMQIKLLDNCEVAPHLYTRCIHYYKDKDLQVYISFNPAYTGKGHQGVIPTQEYMRFVVDGAFKNNVKSTLDIITTEYPRLWNKLMNKK